MTISLKKGERISLAKVAPSLVAGFIGLGWDVNVTDTGGDFDLDVSVFLLGDNDKLVSDKHFIFYNNLVSPDSDQSVKLLGDNRTGEGEGDDEGLIVDLRKVPVDVAKIVVTVTIYEADKRKQNFGQVSNAYIRLVDVQTKEEVLRYDLTEDFSVETAVIMAELYRKDGEWRLNAVGSGFQGGLQALLDRYN
ncbi:TerD family protein [Cyanobacterium aponinum UTEX 3222]|uniref:Stress protein n=3 Tax=Cyanobacterium aponinum TaxID=379064 RepID=K9Z9Q9_CYAAP|nr:TerD family protein [Cyanobacterium aponinum]WRL42468.1 TerD family protein [Cyanobacterium aponinum UTEX 3222]AFZ55457.1 stress protein [Cyanobacterium aponinum PCC 10605]MBD2392754.1 TerD family protein [Cyanobacterium aponinum FACHB-4101]MTF40069.1 chemical-damaging agent resistance protein C [Cyanobacterium aponinum 0216]PHV63297.1 chemical-damaging agent resistance protein C [Cyanobacterium aponinum IPPAS B-1201]